MNKKILLYKEGSCSEHKSFKDLFQILSEEGTIVNTLNQGSIETSNGIYNFTYIDTEGTDINFKENVEMYRTELRESVKMLKRQGIGVSQAELAKLGKQFDFLKVDNNIITEDQPSSEE